MSTNRLRLLLAISIIVLLVANGSWAQDVKIKIAIIGLTNPSTLNKSNIGNSLVSILTSEISQAGKYTLLEREALERLKDEMHLGNTDMVDPNKFVKPGGLVGADFLLFGIVSDYTYKERVFEQTRYTPTGPVQVVGYDHIGEVRLDIRLADVRTGETARATDGRGTAHNTGTVTFKPEWDQYVATEGKATLSNLASLLTEASHSAIRDAVRKLNDMHSNLEEYIRKNKVIDSSTFRNGKILADLGQGIYIIGVPNTAGLTVGDWYRVKSELLIKNAKGEVVYRELIDAGMIEVVNISQGDRAKTKMLNAAGNSPARVPKENDVIAFDEDHAKILRGGGSSLPPSPLDRADRGPEPPGTKPDIRGYIDKGDRYLNDGNYSEALAQFRKALQLAPSDPELLPRVAISQAGINNFTDAEENAEKAIATGGLIRFPVAHNHMTGMCEGDLILKRGDVSFQPDRGDDQFTVTSSEQIDAAEDFFPRTRPPLPELRVNWRGQDNKDHKYYLVVTLFLPKSGHCNLIPHCFKAEGENGEKTIKLDKMILRLIKKSLQQ